VTKQNFRKKKVKDRFKRDFEIPRNWEYKKIGELLNEKIILERQDGNHGELHPKQDDFVNKGVPFITADCLVGNKIDYTKCNFLPQKFLKILRTGFSKPNDILLSHKGSLGYTAIVDHSFKTIILSPQTTYYRLSNKLLNIFMFYIFQTKNLQDQLISLGVQSTRNYVSIINQKELLFFYPKDINEQEKIASILSNVDDSIQRHQEYKSKFEILKKGLMQKLLTGQIRVNVK